jgi:hypothetical protein
MPSITIKPNSKSEIIDLTNIDTLEIGQINETTNINYTIKHIIVFTNDNKDENKFELISLKKYNKPFNYTKCYFQNNNPNHPITIPYKFNNELESSDEDGFSN